MHTQYHIIVRGHLPAGWSEVLDGMEIVCLPEGNTRISGNLPDQSALFGLLLRLRDLGLTLVSVNPAEGERNADHQTIA